MKESLILKKQALRNNEYYLLQEKFDNLYFEAKSGKRFTKLMELIMDEKNILLAYRNIKRNGGSETPGTDGKDIKYIEKMDRDKYVKFIQNKLMNYTPKSVRRVEIPKDNGKTRPLGIPCIDDRIVQQCIKQILEPICEAKFHDESYGFRPNRSTKHAIAKAMKHMNISKLHYVVDIDIKGFFDNVNHSKLKKQLWSLGIQDKNLMCVIGKILKSEIEGIGIPTKGTPQGGIISPLLSNIVLNELDWWLSSQWETFKPRHEYKAKRIGRVDKSNQYKMLKSHSNLKEFRFVRYADDFKIFCRDYETAQKIYIATKQWLKERLGLEISPEKSKITNLRKRNTEFLGIKMKVVKKKNKYICKSNMSDKAKRKITQNLKEQIKVIQRKTVTEEVNKLNAKILGVHNYYSCATHIVHDFREINFSVLPTLKTRLGKKFSKKPIKTKTYDKLYGDCKGKIRSICKVSLFPIHACKTKPPLCFSQNICDYTKDGRKLIHSKLNGYDKILQYLLSNQNTKDSAELRDNKLALMIAQKGKCHVLRRQLSVYNMECHHKTPKKLGGTDEYKNLVWIDKDVHKLIHSTDSDTINRYMTLIGITETSLKKVNSLRKLVGNSII